MQTGDEYTLKQCVFFTRVLSRLTVDDVNSFTGNYKLCLQLLWFQLYRFSETEMVTTERERQGVTQNGTAPPTVLEWKVSTGARDNALLKHKPVFINPSCSRFSVCNVNVDF